MKSRSKISHPLFDAARRFPTNPALITLQSSISYDELFLRAIGLSKALSHHGIKPGDIIVLDDLPPIEMIILFWACSLNSGIAFPLNTRFPENTLRQIIDDIQPALVISNRELDPNLSIRVEELSEEYKSDTIDYETFNTDDTATLLMTSGSSGASKLVQHSYKNHIASAEGSNLNIPLSAENKWLLTLPLYHVGGLSILFRAVLSGACIVIPESKDDLHISITEHQVSHISLVATQFQRFLENPQAVQALQDMKAILLGGSSIPNRLIQAGLDLDLPIHVSYGSTEMASQITTTSPESRHDALLNSGKILPGRDLIISHEGEILVKGDTLALGYREGTELKNFRDNDGWFHTGDVGYVDFSGALTVTGRMDNQFISGGENIQPEHIESVLLKIHGIIQALVVPQTDTEFGQRPIAFIQTQEMTISLKELSANLRKTLPGYMIPTAFYYFPEAFITKEMKISRFELAAFANNPNNHLHPFT